MGRPCLQDGTPFHRLLLRTDAADDVRLGHCTLRWHEHLGSPLLRLSVPAERRRSGPRLSAAGGSDHPRDDGYNDRIYGARAGHRQITCRHSQGRVRSISDSTSWATLLAPLLWSLLLQPEGPKNRTP